MGASSARAACKARARSTRPRRQEKRDVTRVTRSHLSQNAPARGGLAAAHSLVVLAAQVRDALVAGHPAQRVLQLHELHEEIVLDGQPRRGHRALEVETEPLLDSPELRALT